MQSNKIPALILGICLGGALVLAGFFLGDSIISFKKLDRYVTVKGLAEKEYPADVALWPISYSTTGNSLQEVQRRLEGYGLVVRTFLEERGLDGGEISIQPPKIEDRYRYVNKKADRPAERYLGTTVLTLRSTKPAEVKKAMSNAGVLISRGVTLVQNYEYRPQFKFTKLNDIKPEMIAIATRNARKAAAQFAEDSGSNVGSIRSASQGFFVITDRDQYTPDVKKVRVVTTVDYYLED